MLITQTVLFLFLLRISFDHSALAHVICRLRHVSSSAYDRARNDVNIYACAVKPCDILDIRKALLKPLYCVTFQTVFNVVNLIIPYVDRLKTDIGLIKSKRKKLMRGTQI
jgi:hypothetical protein